MNKQLKTACDKLATEIYLLTDIDSKIDGQKTREIIRNLADSILSEVRDMIDDAVQQHEDGETQYDKIILTFDKGAITVDNEPKTVWKPGWLAWETATLIYQLVKLLNPGINNSWQVEFRNDIKSSSNILESSLSIPTAEQLAGEIGGVKVIAHSKNDNTENKIIELVYENEYAQSYFYDSYNVGIAICKKFNIPILSWEQIVEQYGGEVPELKN
jgi:hypothetical protein